MKWLPFVAILALALGGQIGCVTRGTTTDGDRQVEDQSRQALESAVLDFEAVREKLTQGSEPWTLLGHGLEKVIDAKRGVTHLQEVHGPPLEPKIYSKANMDAAIAQSIKEHTTSPFTKVLIGAGGVLAGIAGAYFGMPWLAGFFPKLAGKTADLAQMGVELFTSMRKKSEESGGKISTRDMLELARAHAVSFGVEKLVDKKATAFEEKLGFKPTVKLAGPSTTPAAAVAAAAT